MNNKTMYAILGVVVGLLVGHVGAKSSKLGNASMSAAMLLAAAVMGAIGYLLPPSESEKFLSNAEEEARLKNEYCGCS